MITSLLPLRSAHGRVRATERKKGEHMESGVLILYVTCADLAEARRIGRALVEEGLAACVNIRPHETIYRWQGAIEEGSEAGMLVKTTAAAGPAAEARIVALHSYRVPGILAFTPTGGLPAFLAWIGETVA
jgi:periplasmic divalent cation tolerance protein